MSRLCVHIYRSQKIDYEESTVDLCTRNEFLSALWQTNSGVHPASCAVDIEESLRGVKSLEHEAEHIVQCLGWTSPVFMHGPFLRVHFTVGLRVYKPIAGLFPQRFQRQAQVTLASLGWCHKSGGCAESCARRSECFYSQSAAACSIRLPA